ncbi:MAG TPA: DapH/DapD/GlmU-related protein [Solirubrobacteraceae bacterium]|nr:DapH/DapD/GlmU-related protein [Solirubrobacteraceae bacterium]
MHERGEGVQLGPNVVIGQRVRLGDRVSVGANVVIGDDVSLGDEVIVDPGAVIGKVPRLGPRSRHEPVSGGGVRIEAGACLCAHAVVFVDVVLGPGAIAGEHTVIREGTRIGAGSVLGRNCGTSPGVRVGERVRIQATGGLAVGTIVEDDVFIGPSVFTLSDGTVAPGDDTDGRIQAVTLRRASRIGGGVTLMPGVCVGEEAMVAAGSLVTHDVAAHTLVMGRPARFVRELLEQAPGPA